jgi:hypothetical protein
MVLPTGIKITLKPFEIVLKQTTYSKTDLHRALEGLALALPPKQIWSKINHWLHHLPTRVWTIKRPMADHPRVFPELVRQRLDTVQHTMGEQLDRPNQRKIVRKELLNESALPPPTDR